MDGYKAGLIALLLVAGASRNAHAFLDTGTLLTNAASATYTGRSQGTSVTYSATAKILVANPAMFLWKKANGVDKTYVPTAGGIVTYSICFSNGGANTAFNFTITDRWPNNTYWAFAGSSDPSYGAWVGGAQAITASYTTVSLVAGPWQPVTAANPPAGSAAPPTGTATWIRWVIPMMGVGYSGCVTFALSVG